MWKSRVKISIVGILIFLGIFIILGIVQTTHIREEYKYLSKSFEWEKPLSNQISLARKGNKGGAIRENRDIVFLACDYDKIYDMKKEGFYIIEKNGKKGIVDAVRNKVIAEPIYDYIGHPGEKYIYVRGEEAGYMDYKGEIKFPISKYSKGCKFSEGLCLVFYADKIVAINEQGADVFSIDVETEAGLYYEGIDECYFSEGLAPITIDGEKYGYINKRGETVIKPVFDYASPVTKGKAKVSFYGTSGVIITGRGE